MPDALDLLLTRRSIPANRLGAPGPDPAERDTLLTIAARVPDHGKLVPWRFITVEGEERAALAAALNARLAEINPGLDEAAFDFMRDRLTGAPLMVAIVSCAAPHPKIPEWEQELSAGAAAMNLVHGASALGYAAQWVTDWYAYDEGARSILGLQGDEKVVGFVHVGTPLDPPTERARPELDQIVSAWRGRT